MWRRGWGWGWGWLLPTAQTPQTHKEQDRKYPRKPGQELDLKRPSTVSPADVICIRGGSSGLGSSHTPVARALKDVCDGLDVRLQGFVGGCDFHRSLVVLES